MIWGNDDSFGKYITPGAFVNRLDFINRIAAFHDYSSLSRTTPTVVIVLFICS